MYTEKRQWLGQVADNLGATGDGVDVFITRQRIKVHEVGVVITTVMNGAATIQVDKTNDTSRGTADAGSIVVPTTTAVNKVVKDTSSSIFPFVMGAGEFLTFEVTSAATSGAGIYYVVYELIEEAPANESDVTESA